MTGLELRERMTSKAVRDVSGISERPGKPSGGEASDWGLRQRGSLQLWRGRHQSLLGRVQGEEQDEGQLWQMSS